MSDAVGIEVRDLTHEYPVLDGSLTVLEAIDLSVAPGGYVSVTGPSGSGKSTLLSVIGGLERPQTGSVRVGDADLADLRGDELAAYRRATVGFVFQHFGLLETLTAAENIELACTLNGTRPRQRRELARELLNSVGLADRADHRPLEMSGGERQRVAIARAVVNHPRLILADEPTGNLDNESTAWVVALLEEMHESLGCTLVVVSHNQQLARRASQRLSLRGGRALQVERPQRRARPLRPAPALS